MCACNLSVNEHRIKWITRLEDLEKRFVNVGFVEKERFTVTSTSDATDVSDYEFLGITPNATTDDIRKAYFRLSIKYHPDKSSEYRDGKMFNHLNRVYKSLLDKKIRETYYHEITCPISLDIIEKPLLLKNEKVTRAYELECITRWLKDKNGIDPMIRQKAIVVVIPDVSLPSDLCRLVEDGFITTVHDEEQVYKKFFEMREKYQSL